MKYRIPIKRLIFLLLIVYIVLAAAIFLFLRNYFTQKWDISQPIIISIYTLVFILAFILSYTCYYYEIGKRSILVTKFTKKIEYFYKDILYLDDSKGSKIKIITFVTYRGDVIYLNNDKDGKVYDALANKCSGLLSYAEIKDKFPNIKL